MRSLSSFRRRNQNRGLFLGQVLRHPGQIGAIYPSSHGLGRMMTRSLGPDTGAVVELGGGTGRITEAILARGIPPDELAVYEMDGTFAALLRHRFPRVTVLECDAGEISRTPLGNVGAVVSSLPLLAIPAPVQRRIVEGAFELMRPGGAFIQFTYGLRPSIDRPVRDALGLSWTVSPWVFANMPPARVYTFRQAA